MADDIDHLRTELKMLGNQHKKWKATAPILRDLIRRAAAAGMKQVEIADLSGYERDNIRLLCMDDADREELRRRRRRGVDQVALDTFPTAAQTLTVPDPSRVRGGRRKRKEP